MVIGWLPTAPTGVMQGRTAVLAPTWLVHAPHTPTPQPYFGPGHAEQIAQHPEQRHVGGRVDGAGHAVHVQVVHGHRSTSFS